MKCIQVLWGLYLATRVTAGHPESSHPNITSKEQLQPFQHSRNGSARPCADSPGQELERRDAGRRPTSPVPGITSMDITVPGHDHAQEIRIGFVILTLYVFSTFNRAWVWWRNLRPADNGVYDWTDATAVTQARPQYRGGAVIGRNNIRGAYEPWQAGDEVRIRLHVPTGQEVTESTFNYARNIPIAHTIFTVPTAASDGVRVTIPGGIELTIFQAGPVNSFVLVRNTLTRRQVFFWDNLTRVGSLAAQLEPGTMDGAWLPWVEGDWIRWSSPPPDANQAGPSNAVAQIHPLHASEICFYVPTVLDPMQDWAIGHVELRILRTQYYSQLTVHNNGPNWETYYIRIRRDTHDIMAATIGPGRAQEFVRHDWNGMDVVQFRVFEDIPPGGLYHDPSLQTTLNTGLAGTRQFITVGYLQVIMMTGETEAQLSFHNTRTGGPTTFWQMRNLRTGLQTRGQIVPGASALVTAAFEPLDQIIFLILADDDPIHGGAKRKEKRGVSIGVSNIPAVERGSISCTSFT